MPNLTRRDLLKASAAALSATALPSAARGLAATHAAPTSDRRAPRLRFGVVGANHDHIHGMIGAVVRGGGELVSYHIREPEIAAAFARRYPQAKAVADERAVLDDPSIKLVLSSIIPVERAPLGIRVMKAGKDYLSDKPGITTLDQLAEVRRVQAQTKRIYSILYSERLEVPAAVKAGELVKAGAIGDVVQTVNLAPHRINPPSRPEWFWDPAQYGGILTDIGSHQIDQFLFYTGSTKGEVVAAQVGNMHHPEHPKFQDFGDVMLRGDGGTGYVRVDWFTPAGLPTWGDGRLTILGTDGYIEARKYVDIGGLPGGNHLFLVDGKGIQRIDCSKVELPFGRQLVDDVLNRTETAMSQAHCFLATELTLKAQKAATNATKLA
ncbi:Oxidoreductase domain-containing protein [Gemmatirosa kalamazoonensis]|uniref:Oxidoreductase domain-containing protein n=1 Tax=Gemmatirosa kalamazoonensis TaxID=861299 RepID=W0RFT2_9BACT|nr:Gfo/Idh/MocA family oxidoreductase [Gemmatirosa kalamazoonensis]AHG89661.1 Oxidoreductase domain-containing protein [Gemmatirosa kalamazoonensis]